MKTAIITGADGGIGKELTMALAQKGFHIVMVCRDKEKGNIVCRQITEKIKDVSIEVMEIDLASFRSINQFVQDFQSKYDKLDVLLNNAGVLHHQPHLTEQGVEYNIGVNYLGAYLLTEQLFPCMYEGTRIVNTVSLMLRYGKIAPDFFAFTPSHYNRFTYYSYSKLALYYATLEWAEKWKDKGITVNCVDPGIVNTNIIRTYNKCIDKLCDIFYRPIIRTPRQGADSIIYLATEILSDDVTGKVFKSRKIKKIAQSIECSTQRVSLLKQTEDFIAKQQMSEQVNE